MDGDQHWVVTRDPDGSSDLVEGLLVPGDVDPAQPWEQLQEVAIATWGRQHTSGDPTGDRARDDEMLLQFGWERSHGPRGPHHFPVRRAAIIFRAVLGPRRVEVCTPDGVSVAAYDVESGGEHATLEQNGWLTTHAISDELGGGWAVRPFDWPRIVRHVSQARKSAQAKLEAADLGWREMIRSALLAGQEATTLATLTGLTRQRIYQVRDGRR